MKHKGCDLVEDCVKKKKRKTKWICGKCCKEFAHVNSLNRHQKIMHTDKPKLHCSECGCLFTRLDNLKRHMTTHKLGDKYVCHACNKDFYRNDKYKKHLSSCVRQGGGGPLSEEDTATKQTGVQSEDPQTTTTNSSQKSTKSTAESVNGKHSEHQSADGPAVQGADHPDLEVPMQSGGQENDVDDEEGVDCNLSESALKGTLKTRTVLAQGSNKYNPLQFLAFQKSKVRKMLEKEMVGNRGLKWYISIQVKFSRKRGDTTQVATPHFRGHCQIVLKDTDIEHQIEASGRKIYTSFSEFQREGSSWGLDQVLQLKVHMAKYTPLKGSSYIPTPIKLRGKHAIINVKNHDKKCFQWAILSALYPAKQNAERLSKYIKYKDELDFSGLTFPIKACRIPVFEKQNSLSINLFGYEKGGLFPVYITSNRFEQHINLLLLSDGKKSHYCWIKDLNRLLYDQNRHKGRTYFCPYCLHGFTKENLLEDHKPYCQIHGPQKVELPNEANKWLYYKDVEKQLKVPFVIYADFECLTEKIYGCDLNPLQSSTQKKTHHVPSGYSYQVVSLTDEYSWPPVLYRGSNVAEHFVQAMLEEQEKIGHILSNPKPLQMMQSDWQMFNNAKLCHICEGQLGEDKVRDHCHLSGKFRGAAHNACNVNYRITDRIPVIFHNLRNYDGHLIMQAIGKVENYPLKCIANNMERYISFSLGNMVFIDSFQFMSTSLEKLVQNMSEEEPDKFKYTSKHFGADKLHLLMRKGVYPYDYMDSPEKFEESCLPPKEAFYNTLTEQQISDKDYRHALEIWKTFKICNLGQYHDFYMVTDTLLLADVFENFRNLCLKNYMLDPAHFYTAPGLAWQACLKMTGVRLELLTDLDMHLFVEQGLRGGISMISNRYAKANNPYLPNYNPKEPNVYIAYLDANNLYGWAMSQALPTHDFHWLSIKDIENFDVGSVSDDGDKGYILEVDLEYPEHLHNAHSDYPLAPEKLEITLEMLSPYDKALLNDLGINTYKSHKLVPNLRSKQKYVVHYRNLKLYQSLGLHVTKIHRVLGFQQSPWLKPYIDFNTENRKQAKSQFEQDFFKLTNNSVYGKTMENLRKHVDIRLVNSDKKMSKLTCKANFHAFKIFSKDLAAAHMLKVKLFLNRPIYVGFSILELSKTLMYDFHYNHIKVKYGSRAKLLFTDTDSLCYEIQTKDVYDDMLQDSHLYDTSAYPTSHPLYSITNKKVLGKMKDECNGIPPTEFIGLRSKMYSLLYDSNEKKAAKGVSRSVIQQHLTHNDYRSCLFERQQQTNSMQLIRSENHKMFTISLTKISLSPFDDKRYILDNGCDTLAHGHHSLNL